MRRTIFVVLISLFYVMAGCTAKKKDKRIIIINDKEIIELAKKEGR